MRVEFDGSVVQIDPITLVFTESTTFDKTPYSDYTHYDVIAIGAGGGRGGGCLGTDTNDADTTVRTYGGAGGGGGFHRVWGLLNILPDSIDVVVGAPGDDAPDELSDPGDTVDGDDGTYSQFGIFCGASGGKGGIHSQSMSYSVNSHADGGQGGLGGQTDAGYGGLGGVAGLVAIPALDGDPAVPAVPGTPGANGILRWGPFEFRDGDNTAGGIIGGGGGGGTGGLAKNVPPSDDWAGVAPFATAGGNGSFDSDQAVFGYGGLPFLWPTHFMKIGPGSGGGARITPLNRSTKAYGSAGQPGVVAIRLSKE